MINVLPAIQIQEDDYQITTQRSRDDHIGCTEGNTHRGSSYEMDVKSEIDAEITNSEDGELPLVTLNVRGCVIQISRRTLRKFPQESDFTSACKLNIKEFDLLNNTNKRNLQENTLHLERNAMCVNHILDYFVNGVLHFSHDLPMDIILAELEYFGINKGELSNCCLERLLKEKRDDKTYNKIVKMWNNFGRSMKWPDDMNVGTGKRFKLWQLLEKPSSSKLSQMYSVIMGLVVILAASALLLETVEVFRTQSLVDVRKTTNLTINQGLYDHYMLETETKMWFAIFDFSVGGILGVEFIIRVVVSPKRKKFLLSLFTIADALAMMPLLILPWILLLSVHFTKPLWTAVIIIYLLRMFRMIRLLELIMHQKYIKIMFVTIRRSLLDIGVVMCLILVFSIIFGPILFFVELRVGTFFNVLYAQWYAIITMTTVGYGDFVPKTTLGYITGVMCAFSGIVVIAMATTVVVNNFLITSSAVEKYLLLSEVDNEKANSKSKQ